MYVDKFLTKKVKSWIMKEGSREMLIPPLQIKAVVFNISCTHRQKRQKVHYSFVDGVYQCYRMSLDKQQKLPGPGISFRRFDELPPECELSAPPKVSAGCPKGSALVLPSWQLVGSLLTQPTQACPLPPSNV